MDRRQALQTMAGAAGCALLPAMPAHAQSYPARPVRWLVPFPPGGTMDQVVRAVAQGMQGRFGQTLVIENKPGAGTVIAVDQVAKSAPDGYTLVTVANSFTINPSLYAKLPYDTEHGFTPVALLGATANILVGRPGLEPKTLPQLIAYARRHPGKLTYASFGTGTSAHLAGEMLKQMAGVDILHVPYKGGVPALTDILGGQVDLMINNLPDMLPYLANGKLRGYGVTSRTRSALAPDLPTIAEQGYPDFETNSWYGVLAPAGTPAAVVAYLNQAINGSLEASSTRTTLGGMGFDVAPGAPSQLGALIAKDLKLNAKLVRDANIKLD
ncbi:Bug family tripartite tricarboxylate transporter substrate binding protein [Pigmentiphaga kullae]|uniref:Tripartite-type tricarboxylate transporter receptor subunit TctC n=1 Tax=Pigmentiphaga kullae TaxID=151784 RepID=A0A4V2F482_9BURK|nr:tripartite tricarboxylate transporter substrate binding protein [Pigmentiphaga kullae]RZS86697.1 tripartite-type tricarboxylate transporter receptor subunit TctC [Pigmentiphaga kullae]